MNYHGFKQMDVSAVDGDLPLLQVGLDLTQQNDFLAERYRGIGNQLELACHFRKFLPILFQGGRVFSNLESASWRPCAMAARRLSRKKACEAGWPWR